jgi:hypothetical protein
MKQTTAAMLARWATHAHVMAAMIPGLREWEGGAIGRGSMPTALLDAPRGSNLKTPAKKTL